MTDAEVMLWSRLRLKSMHGLHFRRQHPIGPYIADFACVPARFVLEVDGATHSTKKEVAHDRHRDAYMKQRGWRVLRITNEDVYRNIDNVFEMILALTPPPPSGDAGASPSTSPATAGEERFAKGQRP
ncbi:MAG: endonuclease domain-containing protein [Pseudomonadota bacterium]|nr:endonuclease domain-containing protein [Pseudomonadota bacterium]